MKKELFYLISLLLLLPFSLYAFSVERLGDVPVVNDFVISPAKVEFDIRPGENIIKNILVTNRSGEKATFWIEFEKLEMGEGSRSLAEFMHSSVREFSLFHGETANISISINIPNDEKSGGMYGVVLISSKRSSVKDNSGGANIITRAGSVFLCRIDGEDVLQSGEFLGFEKVENGFKMDFKNNGDSHLNPYGTIELKDIFGRTFKKIGVDPWFVLPKTQRTREIVWEDESYFYFYKVSALLYPGYGGMDNIKIYKVWVYSEKTAYFISAVLVFSLVMILYFFKRKKKIKNEK